MLTRRQFVAIAAAATVPMPVWAQEIAQSDPLFQAQWDLIFGTPVSFAAAIDLIRERGKTDMAAGLIQALRFSRGPQAEMNFVLTEITGETGRNGWFEWMLWQEQNPETTPHASFVELKRELFLRIDPNFNVFLMPNYLTPESMGIRLEEITWGGIQKDGIPSLDNPELKDNAEYLLPDDLIFGVSINGDERAYPLRIMGWHEMFNDVIGGVPVALAYCTLCGSGILFETQVAGEAEPLVFGSSGFLYRSNKLMFDRRTHSLWNQFTGQPVVGPLVGSGYALQQRPVVIDTWENWKKANPDTKVLSLETGFERDYGSGVVYKDYFSSTTLMFPTTVDQSQHAQKDFIFGVRQFGAAKAWPLTAFADVGIINDNIAGRNLVLIGDATTRSVRAYERGDLSFTQEMDGLASGSGVLWQVTEDALIGSNGATLPRVAGHVAYWFAWNGYLGAEAELFNG